MNFKEGLKNLSFRTGVLGLAMATVAMTASDSLQIVPAESGAPTFTLKQTGSELGSDIGSDLAYSSSEYQIILPNYWKWDGRGGFEYSGQCGLNGKTLSDRRFEIDTKPVGEDFSLDHFKKEIIATWRDEVRTAAHVAKKGQALATGMIVDVRPASMGGIDALRLEAEEPNLTPDLGRTRVAYLAIVNGEAVSIALTIPPYYDGNLQYFTEEFDGIASSLTFK